MIYLDYQATTPLAPEARAAMLPWLDAFGNPHSPHVAGRRAAAAVAVAREQIAGLFGGGDAGKILFTSGATEAANLAIKGIAATAPPTRRHIVAIATEHACVLDPCDWLASRGWRVTRLPVGHGGIVDMDAAAAAIDGSTALVCAMLVNNEIGVVQPLAELGRLARAAGARLFCDAVQGIGRVPLPLAACDLVAVSAHKLFGPKGIGALWVRGGIELEPLIHGGGQEGGLRSGTLSPMLCAGFGAAARAAAEQADADRAHVEALWACAQSLLGCGWVLNGAVTPRWHGNFNVRCAGIDAGRLMSEVRNIAFSAGSACASGSGRPSHVLRATGLTDAEARSSIRIGFGRGTDADDFANALAEIDGAATRQLEFGA